MKVLHFYKTYYPDSMGGIEQVIFQLAEGGKKFGVESEVLSLSRIGCTRNNLIGTHRAHKSKLDINIASTGFSHSVISDFAELASQADIIHYHFPWPFMDMVHFITRLHKPTILTYHSDIVKQKWLLKLYNPLMHAFMNSVDHIVATSPNYVATSSVLQRYKDKTSVIPIGLDKDSYPVPVTEKCNYWQAILGSKFFLFVGNLRYYKGLHILLDALQGVDYPVAILGSGVIEKDLRKQAELLGLKNIHFLGALSDEDKVSLIQCCYAMVFPSHLRSEAFGISLLEGAMFGKPMISCEIGTGTTFINVANETGLVTPPADSDALRKAMRTLWDNPSLAEKFGHAGKARFQNLFTADVMIQSYVDLYRQLLNSHK